LSVSSPEKAGVGGSIPSLATGTFIPLHSKNYGAGRLASSESAASIAGGWLSMPWFLPKDFLPLLAGGEFGS